MSQANVESARRAFDAFNRGDLDALFQEADTDAVYHLSLPAMFGGEATVIRGSDELREFYGDLMDAFAEFQIEISDIRDLGERVFAVGQLRASGKESGAEVDSPIAYVVQYRNGKVLRVNDYFDPNEALEAAGLSE
jgi:ketosteroid isomerase-like protein